jgi:hypothetical protein
MGLNSNQIKSLDKLNMLCGVKKKWGRKYKKSSIYYFKIRRRWNK